MKIPTVQCRTLREALDVADFDNKRWLDEEGTFGGGD